MVTDRLLTSTTTAPTELVGVCYGATHRSMWNGGDVIGLLLGRFDDGWAVVARHISSTPTWSRQDIDRQRAKLPDRIPYEWHGFMTMEAMTAKWPPAPPPSDPTASEVTP